MSEDHQGQGGGGPGGWISSISSSLDAVRRSIWGPPEANHLLGSRSPDGFYNPSYKDVLEVREVLASLKLPLELVLDIVERARYWPMQEFATERSLRVASSRPKYNGAKICSLVPVLDAAVPSQVTDEKVKIKEIQWDITSNDQGWTSEGTTGTFQSHSWTELVIVRPASDNAPRPFSDEGHYREYINYDGLPQLLSNHGWEWVTSPPPESKRLSWRLQNNRVAEEEPETYHVTCNHTMDKFEGNPGAGHGIGFLKQLQKGDRIMMLARAQYPGWLCQVQSLKMRVYYGF